MKQGFYILPVNSSVYLAKDKMQFYKPATNYETEMLATPDWVINNTLVLATIIIGLLIQPPWFYPFISSGEGR